MTSYHQLAADQGDAPAQYNLAVIYGKGTGTLQDSTKAAQFLKLACDQGYQPARVALDHIAAM